MGLTSALEYSRALAWGGRQDRLPGDPWCPPRPPTISHPRGSHPDRGPPRASSLLLSPRNGIPPPNSTKSQEAGLTHDGLGFLHPPAVLLWELEALLLYLLLKLHLLTYQYYEIRYLGHFFYNKTFSFEKRIILSKNLGSLICNSILMTLKHIKNWKDIFQNVKMDCF